MNNGFNELWKTPVYKGVIEDKDLLDRVCTYLISNEKLEMSPSEFQKYDILNDGPELMQEFRKKVVYPAFKNFLEYFNINLDNYSNDITLRSWLTGAHAGYRIPVHNHSGASAVAVFYLLCDEDKGGDLIIVDPRTNANRGHKPEFKPHFENKIYTPKSGEFIILPGYVYHHTNVFTGSIRLAIPVDLFF